MNRDYSLVIAWKNGDSNAAEILFNENAEKLGRWIAKQQFFHSQDEIHDIVSETFFRATAKIEEFRGESTLFTWLCAIGRFVIKETTRKESCYDKKTDISESVLFSEPSYFGNPEQIVLRLEESAALREAFAALKPEYQDILLLRLIERLKYETISSITGRTIDSLEKANRLALKALEKNFERIYIK